jgi:uncharacterized protein YozE (UPF0346 family)
MHAEVHLRLYRCRLFLTDFNQNRKDTMIFPKKNRRYEISRKFIQCQSSCYMRTDIYDEIDWYILQLFVGNASGIPKLGVSGNAP